MLVKKVNFELENINLESKVLQNHKYYQKLHICSLFLVFGWKITYFLS